jgi:hypothetical protein
VPLSGLSRYTEPHMDDYSESWREYRRRRNFLLLAFFSYVPIVGLVAVVTVRLFGTTTPAFVAAFTWMALYAIASGFRDSNVRDAANGFLRSGGITTCMHENAFTAACLNTH